MNTQLFRKRRFFDYCLLSLLIALTMLCPALAAPAFADSPMPENKVPGWVESTARRLANGLKQQGYEVGRGYFKLYTKDDCPYSYEVLHSCLGNNPAAPYVLPIVPPWPDEWVDPGTAGMVGPTVEGYNASYRLDPREAIVIIAQLPPPARYFGLQTYLLSRPGEWKEEERSVPVRKGQHQSLAPHVLYQAAQQPGAPAALRGPERPHQQCGDPERVGCRLGSGALLRHHAGQDHGRRGPASPRPAWHPGQGLSSPSRSLPCSETRIWRSGSARRRMIS